MSADSIAAVALHALPDGVFVSDSKGRYVEVNAAASRLTGYARDELLQMSVFELLAPEEVQRSPVAFDRLRAEHSVVRERLIVHREGHRVPVEVHARMLPNGLMLAVVRDISERKVQEERQRDREIQDRRAERLRELGTLAGGVAHDFNNLLLALSGFGELARMELEDEHPARSSVDELLGVVERGKALVARVLDVYRAQTAQPRIVRVTEWIANLQPSLQASLPPGVSLQVSCDDLAVVRGDGHALQQVLDNLASNGAHAMPSGGVLRIGVQRRGDEVGISVRDQGAGMPEDVRKRMFEPFFSTRTGGIGTGLGLTLVQQVVTAHQGRIEVASSPGRGTTVSVWLPAATSRASTTPTARSRVRRGSGPVLVVDDDVLVRQTTAAMLRALGYSPEPAGGVREGIERFGTRHDWVVVWTDLSMTDGDGLALARALRERGATVPIVLSSGFDADVSEEDWRTAGVTALLAKPYDLQTMGICLGELTED